MASDDESIDPVLDRLWYFDSVFSASPCKPSSSPPRSPRNKSPPSSLLTRESSLPLSTGGLSLRDLSFSAASFTEESDFSPSQDEMQDAPRAFTPMNDNRGNELNRDDLYPWMKSLGLQYTTDGMIQVKPGHDDWNESGNLESSTFLLNELIGKESKGALDEQPEYNETQLATQQSVVRRCTKNDNGLISPEELRKALSRLGLLKNGTDAGSTGLVSGCDGHLS